MSIRAWQNYSQYSDPITMKWWFSHHYLQPCSKPNIICFFCMCLEFLPYSFVTLMGLQYSCIVCSYSVLIPLSLAFLESSHY